MTAIRDAERSGSQKLDSIRRRQDAEVKNLVNNHQNYKADLNKAQELDILQVKHNHKDQINNEAVKKEKVLEDMKRHLDVTKKMTEKEIQDLKDDGYTTKAREEQNLTMARERTHHRNQMYLDDMNERFNNESRKLHLEGNNKIQEMSRDLLQKKTQNQEFHTARIQQQTGEFTSKYNTDEANYKKLKYEQDTFQKKERMATNQKQQKEMSKLVENHIHQLEVRDNNFRKGLTDQDLFFEKKYAEHLKKNNDDLKKLNDLNQKFIAKLKTDLSKQVTSVVEKSGDAFYQFTTLSPKMTEFPDRVEVKVKVPEYSKQDLLVTLNGKDINVNLNRRFNDANKTLDGAINKINKVESFSTKLTASNFLDPKSLKSSYENGVMTYTIKYA